MCAPLPHDPNRRPSSSGSVVLREPRADVLVGSRCAACDNVAFPQATGCQRCGARSMTTLPLSTSGRVWGHTVQRFAPKSPPYVVPESGFVPFAVGYVELPEGVKIEAVLDCATFEELAGAEVTLVATSPVPRFATATADAGAAPGATA
ncbi:Zn-ribbon domain-containing OB-fold protein [Nocardioides plantarum]|uniref:Zn-ribbon domain-containing OB-fold protein n=1 Tax=Nocardioides plantarum TaxID=29299 RepID=A0ABV5KEW8_9ACTN|nr:OB-fold domain-containing protein [Nocardioides plantarum]